MKKIEILPVSYSLWAQDKAAFAQAFGESFVETGFAIISDHAIPSDVIKDADALTKAFFDLPTETKLKYIQMLIMGFNADILRLGLKTPKGMKFQISKSSGIQVENLIKTHLTAML